MIERNLKYGLYYNAIANCKRKNDGVVNAAERGEEFMQNRKATQSEERLLEFLINRASTKVPNDWKEKLIVYPMDDGEMGSLYLSLSTEMVTKRLFGEQISECHFLDRDGIDVIASLNVDKNGNLFELDIWKTDYSPLIKIPEKFDELVIALNQ